MPLTLLRAHEHPAEKSPQGLSWIRHVSLRGASLFTSRCRQTLPSWLQAIGDEIMQFQQERQGRLNELETAVLLHLHQVSSLYYLISGPSSFRW